MTYDPLKYWLVLDSINTIGLGAKRIKAMYDFFDDIEIAYHASLTDLSRVPRVPVKVWESFVIMRDNGQLNPDKYIESLQQTGINAYTYRDSLYPAALHDLESPPLIIYHKGHIPMKQISKLGGKNIFDSTSRSVAIVGTRDATQYATGLTEIISEELAREGFSIITGMARGIDTSAIDGVARSRRTETDTGQSQLGYGLAAVANGVDLIIPSSSRDSYDHLCQHGAILSEYPPGTRPEKGYFPMRNRIIAALAQATVVVEAKEGSGALITADYARQMNKRVFCFAGHAQNIQNKGVHQWLRAGKATLVTSTADILEELDIQSTHETSTETSNAHARSVSDEMLTLSPQGSKKVSTPPVSTKLDPIDKKINKAKALLVKVSDTTNNYSEQEKTIIYALLGVSAEENADQIGAIPTPMSMDKLLEITNIPISKLNSLIIKLALKKDIINAGGFVSIVID